MAKMLEDLLDHIFALNIKGRMGEKEYNAGREVEEPEAPEDEKRKKFQL